MGFPPRRSLCAAVLAVFTAWVVAASAAAPAPRIACDEPVFGFGKRSDDREDLLHTFVLRNDGDVTLRIKGVDQYCGCTDLRLSRETLRPGETAELSVRFSLRGRRGDVEKYLLVHSNDPATPALKLWFRGRVEPDVTVTPLSILLGAVGTSVPATGRVEVAFSAASPDTVTVVRSSSPLFEGGFEAVEPGRLYRVWARTKPPMEGAKTSFLRSDLQVVTSRERSPEIRIPVVASVLDDVLVAPAELIVPGGGEEVTRYASVRPGRVRRFRVTRVDLPDPAMRAVVEPLGEGGWRIRLEGIRPHIGLDGLRLRIHTDIPGGPVFEIPLRVVPNRAGRRARETGVGPAWNGTCSTTGAGKSVRLAAG